MKKDSLKRQFFIAVFPPPAVTEKLRELCEKNRAAAGGESWDWKHQPNFHISLAFPGPLTEAELEKLIEVLNNVDHKTFDLSFDGLGYFLKGPSGKGRKQKTDNHVLWARPDKAADNELRSLHHKIVSRMGPASFKFGNRGITPHMTLARPAYSSAIDLVEVFARANGGIKTPPWRCDRFVLCESPGPEHGPGYDGEKREPGKGRYKTVAEFRLKP
jgi:2'-5' RNA ligase